MRYQGHIDSADHDKWLEIEVTLGTNEAIITKECRAFEKFIKGFDSGQREAFKAITSIEIQDSLVYEIKDRPTLQALMLKKFIDGNGLSVVAEARSDIGQEENGIYLGLLDELFNSRKYPNDIYVYAVYRGRGTPTTYIRSGRDHNQQ